MDRGLANKLIEIEKRLLRKRFKEITRQIKLLAWCRYRYFVHDICLGQIEVESEFIKNGDEWEDVLHEKCIRCSAEYFRKCQGTRGNKCKLSQKINSPLEKVTFIPIYSKALCLLQIEASEIEMKLIEIENQSYLEDWRR